MEHLVLLSLDQRSLWPLQRCVPDYRQVLASPADSLQRRQIEIGPWQRYATRFVVVPVLLAAGRAGGEPVSGAVFSEETVPGTWPMCSHWLMRLLRPRP